MIRVVTLCSGYDSQCLALERLKKAHPDFDYELVAWSEIDKYAIQAHNTLFPQWADRNVGDMTKADWSKIGGCDLLTYSTPCQSISNAGKQKGITEGSGTRSSIIWSTRNAIKELKPKYLMLENVSAFVSKKFIGEFKKWMAELESYGYVNYFAPSFDKPWSTLKDRRTKMYCLNSKNYGVPQNRERVFVISILGGGGYEYPEPFKLNRFLDDVLFDKVDDKYYLSEEAIKNFFPNE